MRIKNNPWVSVVALVLLAAILVLVCTGCATGAEAAAPHRFQIEAAGHGELLYTFIITDTETGVQYMFVDGHSCGGLIKLEG